MKTTTISKTPIFNYVAILSSCGLGYSFANYFIFNKEISIWLLVVCMALFAKSIATITKTKYSN